MKTLARLLYRLAPTTFREVLAEDFLLDIPKRVSEPTFTILAENRRVLERYFTYQAWLWARRNIGDPKKADFNLGVLTAIKSFLTLLGSHSAVMEEHPTLGPVKPASSLKDELEGVRRFVENKPKK